MAIDILVPELGESVVEATVSQWSKQVGDAVAVGEMLVELEVTVSGLVQEMTFI